MLLIEDGLTYFAYYPPLYPTLLAAVGLLVPLEAPTFLAIGFLTDLAIAASMVWLGKLLNANSAPNAAAIYLFWPTAVLMSPIAHKEGLVTLVVLLLIACWLNASKNRFAAAFGALSGVLALTQPSLVLLPAALMLFLRRQSWRRVGIALTAAAIVILPWWIRNFLVFGQFVPLTSGSGFALWVGSTPEGNGVKWVPAPPHLLQGNEIERGRAAMAEAVAWIRANPIEYLHHNVWKLGHSLQGDRWDEKPLAWMSPLIRPPLPLVVLSAVTSIALFAAAAVGLVRVRDKLIKRVVLVCVGYWFLFHIWFEFAERHRYFLVPLLLMLVFKANRSGIVVGDPPIATAIRPPRCVGYWLLALKLRFFSEVGVRHQGAPTKVALTTSSSPGCSKISGLWGTSVRWFW